MENYQEGGSIRGFVGDGGHYTNLIGCLLKASQGDQISRMEDSC